MTETINRNESYSGLDIAYKFSVIEGGTSEVQVIASKSADGVETKIERRYWRDMSFAPTQSKDYLSASENAHIAGIVQDIWTKYPDVQPLIIEEVK